MNSRHIFKPALLVISAIALGGCRSEYQRAGSGPVQHVSVIGRTVMVTLKAEVSLGTAIDLAAFSDVRDDPQATVLQSRFGAASRTWKDRYGQAWREFDTAGAHIEAGVETDDSGPGEGRQWAVYVIPKAPWSKLLDAAVAEHVDSSAKSTSLIIRTSDGRDAVACELEQGRPARCRWFTP